MFVELTHRGSDLKKRKHARPNPKRPNSVPYRDIKRQNDWLTENVFDPMGNYLFDSACIRAALGISKNRLTRLRGVKRAHSGKPLRSMPKADVEKERASVYVVMPSDKEMSFKEWWMSVDPSDTVMVRYPHGRHGNAGRASNSSKTSLMEDFHLLTSTASPMEEVRTQVVQPFTSSLSFQLFKPPRLEVRITKNA